MCTHISAEKPTNFLTFCVKNVFFLAIVLPYLCIKQRKRTTRLKVKPTKDKLHLSNSFRIALESVINVAHNIETMAGKQAK